MAASAQSPPVRNSTAEADHSGSHPVPVVVMTSSTFRSNPPVRRSSATTARAVASRSRSSRQPA